jgi:creatinine amidohydrolase
MLYPDGRMGSNPSLSTGEIGAELFAIAKASLVTKLSDFLKMDQSGV